MMYDKYYLIIFLTSLALLILIYKKYSQYYSKLYVDSNKFSIVPTTFINTSGNVLNKTLTISNGPKQKNIPSIILDPVDKKFNVGETINIKATVLPEFATGQVQILVNDSPFGSPIDLQNNFITSSISNLIPGQYIITVSYLGDQNYTKQVRTVRLSVNKYLTTTTLISNKNPSNYLDTVTFNVDIQGSNQTGSYSIYNNNTIISTNNLVNGKGNFNINNFTIGNNSLYVVYNGDNLNESSTSNTIVQVVNKATPILSVSSSNNYPTYLSTVTIRTTLNPNISTGTISINLGSTVLKTGTITNGISSIPISSSNLIVGNNILTINYSGDLLFNSTSTTFVQAFIKATPNLFLSKSLPSPTDYATNVQFTVRMSNTLCSGKIDFKYLTTTFTKDLDSSGIAIFDINQLPAGNNTITIVYSGDNNFNGFSSTFFNYHTVNRVTPTLQPTLKNIIYLGETFGANVVFSPYNGLSQGSVDVVNSSDGSIISNTTINSSGNAVFSGITFTTNTNIFFRYNSNNANYNSVQTASTLITVSTASNPNRDGIQFWNLRISSDGYTGGGFAQNSFLTLTLVRLQANHMNFEFNFNKSIRIYFQDLFMCYITGLAFQNTWILPTQWISNNFSLSILSNYRTNINANTVETYANSTLYGNTKLFFRLRQISTNGMNYSTLPETTPSANFRTIMSSRPTHIALQFSQDVRNQFISNSLLSYWQITYPY